MMSKRPTIWRSLPAAIALLAAGCSSSAATGSDSSLSGLDEAKSTWDGVSMADYLVTVSQTGGDLDGCSWVTEVHDDMADSRWSSAFDTECGQRDVSVPALHQEVSRLMAESEAAGGSLQVGWAETGVPDSIVTEVDGETVSLGVEFEDLSGQSAEQSTRVALADARQRWSAAEISDYRIEVEENGNYWMSGCRWVTVVADGVVVESSVDASSTGQYCGTGDVWTVEHLHEMISGLADSMDRAQGVAVGGDDPLGDVDTLDVKFDQAGVPETIVFDLAGAADEERLLRVRFTEQN